MPSLEDRLQAIEDRTAIVELTARYCHRAQARDAEGVVALFCDDGVMEAAGTREQGREALLVAYRESFELAPMPCVHNHVVRFDPKDRDRAAGRCSVEVRMLDGGTPVTLAGHYEDEYRRVSGSWRFARRNLVIYHRVPHVEGWGTGGAEP